MTTVKIYAYTKFNLGDDLFIKILCDRYPDTTFKLYAPVLYKELFKDIPNLICYSSESLFNRMLNKIGRIFKFENLVDRYLVLTSDLGVQIGGSLFIEGPDWMNYLENYEKKMRVNKKPFFLIGSNFGPYKDVMFYEKHKELFKEDTDVCFRERYTYELFNELSNVRYAADVVFSMSCDKSDEENHIVISVIKPSYRKNLSAMDETYYKKIEEMSIYYLTKGKKVIYMSFCEYEGDGKAIKEIISRIPTKYHSQIAEFNYKLDLNRALDILRNSEVIIACRFHAMILGFLYGKKVIPLIYSNKMVNVLNDLNFKGFSCHISEIAHVNVNQSLDDLSLNQLDVSEAIKSAHNQFKYLDSFLKNE